MCLKPVSQYACSQSKLFIMNKPCDSTVQQSPIFIPNPHGIEQHLSPLPPCSLRQSGGFYSAEDADSVPASGGPEKREGAFCVWTASEVREHLPDAVEGAARAATRAATRADVFMHHYGVKEQGNVALEQVS